jgi:hypothetical protein
MGKRHETVFWHVIIALSSYFKKIQYVKCLEQISLILYPMHFYEKVAE